MTLYLCKDCLEVKGCEGVYVTHKVDCDKCVVQIYCPQRLHPEKHNHLYITTDGLCPKCEELQDERDGRYFETCFDDD